MATCILDYPFQPNLILDSANSGKSTLTFNTNWDDVTKIQNWTEFNYNTLLFCYEEVLSYSDSQFPLTSSSLSEFESEIWDEDFFEHLLSRSISHTSCTLSGLENLLSRQ